MLANKRVVKLDEQTFDVLEQYASQQGVTMDRAACCFVRAGISSRETSERVEELLEQDQSA